jgi:uncharacterized membrane protein YcjF (UPF0283 family)
MQIVRPLPFASREERKIYNILCELVYIKVSKETGDKEKAVEKLHL